jgi:hypothetical protein
VVTIDPSADIGDLACPPDRPLGQGVEQDPAQVAAQHLGARRRVAGDVEQQFAVLVQYARRVGALVDDRVELVDQAGVRERALAVVLVDVELPCVRVAAEASAS